MGVLPRDCITDLDFQQPANGGHDIGLIGTRLRLSRKVVIGLCQALAGFTWNH
jgi:L-arabinose isomerase